MMRSHNGVGTTSTKLSIVHAPGVEETLGYVTRYPEVRQGGSRLPTLRLSLDCAMSATIGYIADETMSQLWPSSPSRELPHPATTIELRSTISVVEQMRRLLRTRSLAGYYELREAGGSDSGVASNKSDY